MGGRVRCAVRVAAGAGGAPGLGRRTGWACVASLRRHSAGRRSATRFAAFCACAACAGGKFAHRACDRPAGLQPQSMKWVNPPVAYMLHAGGAAAAGGGRGPARVCTRGTLQRVALEGVSGPAGARSCWASAATRATTAPKQTPRAADRPQGPDHRAGAGAAPGWACGSSSAMPSVMPSPTMPAATAWTPCCA
jgi:hypothetical protein